MKEVISEIPQKPGVYFFIDTDDKIIYIGKSINLKKRIADHFRKGSEKIFLKVERENYSKDNKLPMFTWDYTAKFLEKVPSLVFDKENKKKRKIRGTTKSIQYIVTETDEEALTLEGCLISSIRPPLNRMMWKYPFIEITMGEEVPRVLTAYQILLPNSYIFGPFNFGANIDVAMAGFMMVIPICDHDNPIVLSRKALPNCMKYQINRCISPCKDASRMEAYHAAVQEFITELEDNGNGVIKKLQRLMLEETKSENFEGAAIIRDRIIAIEKLFTQKAIPAVLEKYYLEVEGIVGKETGFMEIINKIIENNAKGR